MQRVLRPLAIRARRHCERRAMAARHAGRKQFVPALWHSLEALRNGRLLALMRLPPKPACDDARVAGSFIYNASPPLLVKVNQAATAIRSVDFNLAGLPPGGVRGQ
jgi:hypothetical protein